MTPDHKRTCGQLGPDVRVSPQFVRAACCNRVYGHEQLEGEGTHIHSETNPHTFRLLAWWTEPQPNKQPNRRKVKR